MKAVAIQKFGGPDGLAVVDLPDPTPASGEVLISTEAIGVGFQHVLIRSGALTGHGMEKGHILGGELAGTVSAVGDDVDPDWIGQRVWAFVASGSYADKATARAKELVRVPPGMSAVDAVTIGGSGGVAHFSLRHGRFAAGERVLVRGAAGGIGIMLVQLAAQRGARVVAVTASSVERGERLRRLGATHVLNRAGSSVEDSPADYDVIIDIVGGPGLSSFFGKLRPNGRMVSVGAVAGFPPPDFAQDMFKAFHKSLSFSTFSANPACVPEPERRAVTADLLAAADRGELQAVVHDVLPLEQAVLAHQKMEAGQLFGRIALTP